MKKETIERIAELKAELKKLEKELELNENSQVQPWVNSTFINRSSDNVSIAGITLLTGGNHSGLKSTFDSITRAALDSELGFSMWTELRDVTGNDTLIQRWNYQGEDGSTDKFVEEQKKRYPLTINVCSIIDDVFGEGGLKRSSFLHHGLSIFRDIAYRFQSYFARGSNKFNEFSTGASLYTIFLPEKYLDYKTIVDLAELIVVLNAAYKTQFLIATSNVHFLCSMYLLTKKYKVDNRFNVYHTIRLFDDNIRIVEDNGGNGREYKLIKDQEDSIEKLTQISEKIG